MIVTLERRIAAICASAVPRTPSVLLLKELCRLECLSGDPVRLLLVFLLGMASALFLSGCTDVRDLAELAFAAAGLHGVLCCRCKAAWLAAVGIAGMRGLVHNSGASGSARLIFVVRATLFELQKDCFPSLPPFAALT